MDKNKLLKRIAVFTGVSLTAMHVFNRISTYIATADNLLGADDYNVYDWKYGKISYKKKRGRNASSSYTQILMFSHLLMNGIRS